MRSIPLARMSVFIPFPAYLQSNGSDVARHLSSFGIAPENLAAEENLVPLRLACEFVDQVSAREGIERFGLEVGSRASARELGLFGRALSRSLTLKELIENVVQAIPRVDSGAHAWTEPSREDAGWFRLCLRHQIDVCRATIDAYALLVLIDAVRMAAGRDWRPQRASLDAAAGDVTRYEALSDARMDRDVDYVAFEIPRKMLSLPLLSSAGPAREGEAGVTLEVEAPSADFVESICQTINACFGTRLPTIEQVAQMAGVSVSTLQRRLRAKKVTYQGLVDRVRFQEASRQLGSPDASITDVARHLGYSDVSNFTHAFSRWTGTSPLRYRRKKLELGRLPV